VPVVVAFAAGVLLDRAYDPGWWIWWTATLSCLAVGVVLSCRAAAQRRRRCLAEQVAAPSGGGAATIVVLGAFAGLGGVRHHLDWTARSPMDIGLMVTTVPQLVQLEGIVSAPALAVSADPGEMTPAWARIPRSVCQLTCMSLRTKSGTRPVAGTVRLHVTGHLLHAEVGDRVQVTGWMSVPQRPANPGTADFGQWLRAQGIGAIVSTDHPEAVVVLEPGVQHPLARSRARLRDRLEGLLVAQLELPTVPLAISLLLGDRTSLSEDVRSAFVETGTMHVLAISGLHVGILAGMLLAGCRLIQLSVRGTTLIVLLGVGTYALLTDLRPPVIRASVLAVVVAAGWPTFRRTGGQQSIALCGLAVLMWRPTDLFDVGGQLSFLAVMAIGWATAAFRSWRLRREWGTRDPSAAHRKEGRFTSFGWWLLEAYAVSAAIWLVTFPLSAAWFHVVAPIGLLINVLIIPLVALALGLGFGTLLCGILAPWTVGFAAGLFQVSLDVLQGVVQGTSRIPYGHAFVVGPPNWWLVALYALLGSLWLVGRHSAFCRMLWWGVCGWGTLGLLLPFHVPEQHSLTCTFLAVGHGCSVVLELPGGKTLLYDAGAMGDVQRTTATISRALWARGIRSLDGVIVSHADLDHISAVPGILRAFPVGTVWCARSFVDWDQSAVREVCESAARRGIPIRFLQAGDRLEARDRLHAGDPPDAGSSGLSIEVLHPAPDFDGDPDNANSLVVRLSFGGRTILLTGDLEGDGLERLLAQSPGPVDVWMTPHHGSLRSNPPELADWAEPRIVVCSGEGPGGGGAADDAPSGLRSVYRRAERVLVTRTSGAITIDIGPHGTLEVHEFCAPGD
jgi:competence protein ComEC